MAELSRATGFEATVRMALTRVPNRCNLVPATLVPVQPTRIGIRS